MAKYHVNPMTGDAGKCSAIKGKCPFGDDENHYTSPEAARVAYENTQKDEANSFDRVNRAVEEFGRDSAIFRSWGTIHRDFKTSTDGLRTVMVNSKGAAVLVRWLGPKELENYDETLKKIEVMDKQQELAANPPLSFAGYSPAMNPIDIKKISIGERYYDLEGTAYMVESVDSANLKVSMNPLDDEGNPLGTPGRGVIPVTETRNVGRFYKLVDLRGNYVDSSGGPSESRAVKPLPASGSYSRAVSGVVQYTDEDGNLQTIELVAEVERLTDKRKIEFGRQLWALTGRDPQRYEDAYDEEKLRWAGQRLMRRQDFKWETKDGFISYDHSHGGGLRAESSFGKFEL